MSTAEKDAYEGVATDSKIDRAAIALLHSRRRCLGWNAFRGAIDCRVPRPLDPEEDYKMDHKRRGLALIFNQVKFDRKLGLSERRGSSKDCKNLEGSFKKLNFEVQAFDNLKREDILAKISEAAKADHRHADCFACVFLSHGANDEVYAYDDKISIPEITALFKGDKCRSLVGKPKIFILQACRGKQYDPAVTPMVDSEAEENEVMVEADVVRTLPAGADFLMCYSVAEGFVSVRHPYNGSWYIQDLCEALEKFGNSLEFMELLTVVNRMVSRRKVENTKDPNFNGKKQMPCFASMLTKKLYFRTKNDPDPKVCNCL